MGGNINFHPAPGLGDLLPGWFNVPQNPLAMAAYGVSYTPGIGDILPGAFAVPQNPLKDFVTGQVKMIGQKSHGHGVGDCGCGGSCGGCGGGQINGQKVGMGSFSSDWSTVSSDLSAGNFMGALQAPIMGIPTWAFLAGGLFLYMFMFGGPGASRYQRARAGAGAYRRAYAA